MRQVHGDEPQRSYTIVLDGLKLPTVRDRLTPYDLDEASTGDGVELHTPRLACRAFRDAWATCIEHAPLRAQPAALNGFVLHHDTICNVCYEN